VQHETKWYRTWILSGCDYERAAPRRCCVCTQVQEAVWGSAEGDAAGREVDVDVYARTRTMNLCTAPEPITMDSHTQWTFRLDHAATYKLGEETHLKLRLFHTVRDSDRVTDLLVQPRHEKLAIGREKPMWNGGCHVESNGSVHV
jgi:hypothetical protein